MSFVSLQQAASVLGARFLGLAATGMAQLQQVPTVQARTLSASQSWTKNTNFRDHKAVGALQTTQPAAAGIAIQAYLDASQADTLRGQGIRNNGSYQIAQSLSTLEQGIVNEMNLARQNPEAYANILEQRRQYYNGNRLELPGKTAILTNEGVQALNEAITFLRAANLRSPLRVSTGMSKAATDHVKDQGPKGGIGHIGSDKSTFSQRLNRYGKYLGPAAENNQYVYNQARDVVMALIIDDGVPSRGPPSKHV